MANIKVKFADDNDVEVVEVKRINTKLNKHLRSACDAIMLGAKYAGESSK